MASGNTSKDWSGTNYSLVVDSNGYLKVVLQAGSAAGGAITDDSAFTPGTTEVIVMGAHADETTPDSVDEGDAGAVRMSLDRMLLVQASGRAAEDAAAAGNPLLAGGRYDSANRDLDNGDVGAVALNADAQVIIDDYWRPSLQAEETENDSDKSFTVPASTQWRVKSIWVELTTTADVGDRVIGVEIQDSAADVILKIEAGAVQAASLARYYAFAPWQADLIAFRGAGSDLLLTPLPPDLVLPAGYIVRVYDTAAIAAAADDMIVQMLVDARTV
jgi:hypothetical protein